MNAMSKNSESDKSKGSIQLTDTELADASGGARKIDMPPVTIIVMPPVVIPGKTPPPPKK
jgi:hypothetical protein